MQRDKVQNAPGWALRKLEAQVVGVQVLTGEAFSLVYEESREFDDLECEVVLDQLEAAAGHSVRALLALRPDFESLDDSSFEVAVRALEAQHAPKVARTEAGSRRHTKTLVCEALRCAVRGLDFARRFSSQHSVREVAEELACAASHLEIGLYVFDPRQFRRTNDGASPAERVRLASWLEVLELEVEKARAFARAHIGSRFGEKSC